jgi:uncharacterized protein YigA (DUF484 family)
VIERQFKNNFDVQHCAVFLLTKDGSNPEQHQRSLQNASASISNILNSDSTFCGVLRDEEASFFFELKANSDSPISAAIACRASQKGQFVVAVGHDDSNHYSSDTGTLFIDYIADVVSALLEK